MPQQHVGAILLRAVDDVLSMLAERDCPRPAFLTDKLIERECRRFWAKTEVFASEHKFHDREAVALQEVHQSYEANALHLMRAAYVKLGWPLRQVTAEPLLSILDTTLVQGALYAALVCTDQFLIDEGYWICAPCHKLLADKQVRRTQLGLPERADSRSWLMLYTALAELKWKGSAKQTPRLFKPEQIADGYLVCLQTGLNSLQRKPNIRESEIEEFKQNAAWCGLHVIKMAARWCPGRVKDLVAFFNQVHGDILAPQPGYFLEHRAPALHQEWYWDWELFKWCVLGEAEIDEAEMCYQWRLDSVRASYRDQGSLDSYTVATRKELEFLLGLNPAFRGASQY